MVIFEVYSVIMIKIHRNYSLKNNTTFGVDIVSSWFSEAAKPEDLEFAVKYASERSWQIMIIGEGSNLLFAEPYNGLVIRPLIKGIKKIDESDSEILVKVGAGENWDSFVEYCVKQGWYGPENLSLIPGSVGAAPVQNIGAYGREAKDIIEYVEVLNIDGMQSEILSNSACEFGYRDSIFKHGLNQRYIVTGVMFRLQKKGELQLDYGNVKEEFLKSGRQDLTGLRDTIISIRKEKLPDPSLTGNAGSFFKNPVIPVRHYQKLKQAYEMIPGYPAGKNSMKVPAAWLIENAGFKGVREGDTGTWPNQPLVIVNYGNATGKEIFSFSEKIRNGVEEKFQINLEREVSIIG